MPGPVLGAGKRGLAGRFIRTDLRQAERQFGLGHRAGYAILIVDGERLAPIALAGENGIAKTPVSLAASQSMGLHIILCLLDGLLDIQSIEESGVAHAALLGVERLLGHVAALNDGHDGQIELAGESIVPAVMGGNCHNGTRAVSGQHIIRNPDRNALAAQRIDSVCSREYAGDALGAGKTLALGALLYFLQVCGNLFLAVVCCELSHQLAFRSKDHEGYAEDSVHAGGEYGYGQSAAVAFGLEHHLGTVGTADPVTLHFFQGVAPVQGVKRLEQTLRIG